VSFPNDMWARPHPDTHPRLFGTPTEEVLADLRVTREDVKRWHELGWLSFDVDPTAELQEQHEKEIRFVRHLAVSGMSSAQINEILEKLRKPYAYEPDSMAYHFTHGWVVPRIGDAFDVVDEHVSGWISELASGGEIGRLEQLAAEIAGAIEELDENGEDDE